MKISNNTKCFVLFLVYSLLTSCTLTYKNKYDKSKRKHGKWIGYYDKNSISKIEHYRHGLSVKTWKNYLPNGELYLTEKYSKKGTRVMQKQYYNNGNLYRKGNAIIDLDTSTIWYRWHGLQYFYNTKGQDSLKKFYYQGEFVRIEE